MKRYRFLFALLVLALVLSACGPSPASPTPTLSIPSAAVATFTKVSPSLQPADTSTPTQPPANTQTPIPPTLTPVPTGTPTPTPSAVPTYVKLRGEVTVGQAVCHYGPGQPYLYKYGVVQGSNLEIIGRTETDKGPYLEVQAIGGNNPCWLNAQYIQPKGDLTSVQPIQPEDVILPLSPYYTSLGSVLAKRQGNEVTVAWPPLVLKAGDESEQFPYLVEAWVCRAGQIVFTPVGSWQTSVKIVDEPGCAQPSHGRAYGVEKHGYTRWIEIQWPPASPAAPTP